MADLSDDQFFTDHPDRSYRIRRPWPFGRSGGGEYNREFLSLGPHDASRRRVIVKRVDPRSVTTVAAAYGIKYMPIPFLLFADETIEDTDEVLAPIFDDIMKNAAADLR